jgi:muconate cycloisomerase
MRDLVVGREAGRITDLWSLIHRWRPSATTALGAIDIAVHDLVARSLGLPVHALLGGLVRETVPALTLVGSGDTAVDIEKLKQRREVGYTWFKVKLGMAAPWAELETLATALEIVGEDGVVAGDANEAWTVDEARSFLSRLAGSSVRFIEQPIPRGDSNLLMSVAQSSPVPICADESAGSLAAVLAFAGSPVRGVSLKLIKHGGITGVMQGAAICSRAGLEVNLAGKVIESSISAAANLHCAAAMESIEFGCSPANQGVVIDVSEAPVTVQRGEYAVPTGAGLGIEVDESLVRRLAD